MKTRIELSKAYKKGIEVERDRINGLINERINDAKSVDDDIEWKGGVLLTLEELKIMINKKEPQSHAEEQMDKFMDARWSGVQEK